MLFFVSNYMNRLQEESKSAVSPTRAGGADRNGYPGRVKAKMGGRRAEEKMGVGIIN